MEPSSAVRPPRWASPSLGLALGLLCLASAPLGAARAEPPGADSLGAMSGYWVHVGGDEEEEEEARRAAIERTVQQMPLLFRPFARGRIERATRPVAYHHIGLDGDRLTIQSGTHPAVITDVQGSPVQSIGEGGAKEVITRQITGSCLVSRSQQGKSSGSSRFCLSPEGDALTVTLTVQSDQLPSDIVFSVSYRRRE